jgi:hypothetical protein
LKKGHSSLKVNKEDINYFKRDEEKKEDEHLTDQKLNFSEIEQILRSNSSKANLVSLENDREPEWTVKIK